MEQAMFGGSATLSALLRLSRNAAAEKDSACLAPCVGVRESDGTEEEVPPSVSSLAWGRSLSSRDIPPPFSLCLSITSSSSSKTSSAELLGHDEDCVSAQEWSRPALGSRQFVDTRPSPSVEETAQLARSYALATHCRIPASARNFSPCKRSSFDRISGDEVHCGSIVEAAVPESSGATNLSNETQLRDVYEEAGRRLLRASLSLGRYRRQGLSELDCYRLLLDSMHAASRPSSINKDGCYNAFIGREEPRLNRTRDVSDNRTSVLTEKFALEDVSLYHDWPSQTPHTDIHVSSRYVSGGTGESKQQTHSPLNRIVLVSVLLCLSFMSPPFEFLWDREQAASLNERQLFCFGGSSSSCLIDYKLVLVLMISFGYLISSLVHVVSLFMDLRITLALTVVCRGAGFLLLNSGVSSISALVLITAGSETIYAILVHLTSTFVREKPLVIGFMSLARCLCLCLVRFTSPTPQHTAFGILCLVSLMLIPLLPRVGNHFLPDNQAGKEAGFNPLTPPSNLVSRTLVSCSPTPLRSWVVEISASRFWPLSLSYNVALVSVLWLICKRLDQPPNVDNSLIGYGTFFWLLFFAILTYLQCPSIPALIVSFTLCVGHALNRSIWETPALSYLISGLYRFHLSSLNHRLSIKLYALNALLISFLSLILIPMVQISTKAQTSAEFESILFIFNLVSLVSVAYLSCMVKR